MLNLTQQNKLITELQTPYNVFAGSVYECISKGALVYYHHTSFWRPTQSGWIKAITKNFFTPWPGLSSDLVQKYLTKKKTTILGHLKQPRKGLQSMQIRNSNHNQNQTLKQNQTNFPHTRSQKAPILSSSRQRMWQGKFTQTKQEGFLSHPAKATNIYWWPTIMNQTTFMRNLRKRKRELDWKQRTIKFTAYLPTEVWNLAYRFWTMNVTMCSKLLWGK